MLRIGQLLVALVFCTGLFAQEEIKSTDHFKVVGKIKRELNFTVDSLKSVMSENLGDITTVNSKGEPKTIRKGLKGILLKKLLQNLAIEETKAHDLSAYYFLLLGSDGYKVVLSYSEVIYGNSIYLITESNGQPLSQTKDRIELLTKLEPGKGRIVMKGLETIKVQKAE